MAIEVLMPKLSDTMEEGKIIKWLFKEGDTVANGDIIAEIETDKADMEYEVIDDGIMLKILATEGSIAKVGELIAVIGEEGEEYEAPAVTAAEVTAEKPAVVEVPKPTTEPAPVKPASDGIVKASPVARKLAAEAGLDLSTIHGSGPEGKVIKRDVEKLAAAPRQATAITEPSRQLPKPADTPAAFGRREAMSSMRKTIARRLVESKTTVPHFYLTMDIDMGPIMEARKSINEQDNIKLSVNDFIIKASAKALLQHPLVNAHIEGNDIVYLDSVDIGVAVALEEGLITPYVRGAHLKSMVQINGEVKELATRARDRKLKPEEYNGGSFTISNLGMFGIDHFTAIINPPESTILAVGRAKQVPVVVDGELSVGWRMTITLSCDHRIVDGAVGAQFLSTLRDILEHPMRLLV